MTRPDDHDGDRDRDGRDAESGAGRLEPASIESMHDLAAGYALHALDERDRAEAERMLAESPEFRDEADAFAEAAARLAELGEPVAPPPALKARLLSQLDATRQLAGETAASTPAEERPAPAGERPSPESARPARAAEITARRRWFQRPGAIIGAAAAAVVLIAGAVVGIGWPGPNGWGAQRERAAIASAPDAESATVEAAGGGEVTLVWSAERGRSVVVAEGLPAVGDDETYELWYIDDAGAAPAGTFEPVAGETWRVLEGTFTPGVTVGVTVEPAGGSRQPTTEPIVVIPT